MEQCRGDGVEGGGKSGEMSGVGKEERGEVRVGKRMMRRRDGKRINISFRFEWR